MAASGHKLPSSAHSTLVGSSPGSGQVGGLSESQQRANKQAFDAPCRFASARVRPAFGECQR
jgi:hypothetical protein